MIKNLYAILLFVVMISSDIMLLAQDKEAAMSFDKEEELGKVHWYRDYDQAVALAKKEGKNVVILFQEVPGCLTCRTYGYNVLSHPLIVETLETSFVPLAIYNNKNGKDRQVLNKYREPSWNNPVVRIINSSGNDVVDRIGNDYSALTLTRRLKEALKQQNKPIPEYLNLLEEEFSVQYPNNVEQEVFQMYCFWSGEKELGSIDGVLDVESGFINHSEVVKIKYDPKRINKEELNSVAKRNKFVKVQNNDFKRSNADVHYYLQNSPYKYLPLTAVQQVKINSALGSGQSPIKYLSPTQKKWLDLQVNGANTKKELFNMKFEDAWDIKLSGS